MLSAKKDMKDSLLYKGRRKMLVEKLALQGHFSDKVLKAIGAVPRHIFVQEGLEELAYKDMPVAIEADQTISQPSTVALQTHLLDIKSGDKILEIGTGCGYQCAILFYLGAEVFSIERQQTLFRVAVKNLEEAGYIFPEEDLQTSTTAAIHSGKIHLFLGDGFAGLEKEAPFDGIIVTCGAPYVPEALLKQLKPGGRLIIPVNKSPEHVSDRQILKEIVKTEDGRFKARDILEMSFVPMLKGINRNLNIQ